MKLSVILLSLGLMLLAPQAYSRDTTLMLSIQDALLSADFKAKLDPNVALFFGNQKHPKVRQSYGTFPANKKTNAFNKSDVGACRWAMLSGLIALQNRAKKEGGNAVINIASYYKKNTVKSNTKFECHAGAFVAGVALIGKVVKIKK